MRTIQQDVALDPICDRSTGFGIFGLFEAMPAHWQRRRIRELSRAGLSRDAIAMVTARGIDAVISTLENEGDM